MSPTVKRSFTTLGVVGHLARTVVFALIGYGLVTAAVDYSPRSALGVDGRLRTLRTRRMARCCWASSPSASSASRCCR
jgi:hypothetical protein